MTRYPMRATFALCCACAASGAVSRLRVIVTMHPTALCHIVVSLRASEVALCLLWKPNHCLTCSFALRTRYGRGWQAVVPLAHVQRSWGYRRYCRHVMLGMTALISSTGSCQVRCVSL